MHSARLPAKAGRRPQLSSAATKLGLPLWTVTVVVCDEIWARRRVGRTPMGAPQTNARICLLAGGRSLGTSSNRGGATRESEAAVVSGVGTCPATPIMSCLESADSPHVEGDWPPEWTNRRASHAWHES